MFVAKTPVGEIKTQFCGSWVTIEASLTGLLNIMGLWLSNSELTKFNAMKVGILLNFCSPPIVLADNRSFQRLFAGFISFFYWFPTSKLHYSPSHVCPPQTTNMHPSPSSLYSQSTIEVGNHCFKSYQKPGRLHTSRQLSKYKTFCWDLSSFSVVSDVNASVTELNDDLKKINKWVFQWKMTFNPDPSKQAKKVIFIRKIKKLPHLVLVFNNINVLQASCQ